MAIAPALLLPLAVLAFREDPKGTQARERDLLVQVLGDHLTGIGLDQKGAGACGRLIHTLGLCYASEARGEIGER